MKHWQFKALLIISVLTVVVGYTDVHTPQSVYAQGSEEVLNKDSTESSSSDSNQDRDLLNWLSNNLILVILPVLSAVAGEYVWFFKQSQTNLENNLERLRESEVQKKEIEVSEKFQEKIRQLQSQVDKLQMENGNHELIIAHQIENTCANLNNILEKIGEEQIKKRKNEHFLNKNELNKALEDLSQEIHSLQENSSDKQKADKIQEAGKIQEQINQKINDLEQELSNLEDISSFIPKIKIINDKIIRKIIEDKIIKDIYERYLVFGEQQDSREPLKILDIIQAGFEEFNKYETNEFKISAEELTNNVRNFFDSIK